MPLPIPNLDDRRWLDLTQEAIPLIPRYAPEWTDFNTHDPGITIMELEAWLAESLIYRLNQVPDRFRWKFLALIGYSKRGPLPSHTVIAFPSVPPAIPFAVPTGIQFKDVDGSLFATTRPLNLAQVTLTAMQVDAGTGAIRDYSRDMADGLPLTALGTDPPPGAALYLGFDIIPTGVPVALWFWFEGGESGDAERERIIAEAAAQKAECKVEPGWQCGPAKVSPPCTFDIGSTPAHHSARIVWEVFAAGAWTLLSPAELFDDTRSLTLDGLVEVTLPASAVRTNIGSVAAPLFYLRARLASGAYDAPVILAKLQPNAVAAVQRTPLWQQLGISGKVLPLPTPPLPGSQASLQFTLSPDLTIQGVSTQSPPVPGQPGFGFLNYAPPLAGNPGSLTMQFVIAGIGTAVPSQQVFISGAPVQNKCIRLFSHDGVTWTEWNQVADFDATHRTDLAFTLDPTTGQITCGDGERGQVFPEANALVVTAFAVEGAACNIRMRQIAGLAKSPVNTVLLNGLSAAQIALLSSLGNNVVPAIGGRDAPPLSYFEGEAAQVVHAHERILDYADNAHESTLDQLPRAAVLALPAPSQAVNILDTERIALEVPGTIVARARAWPDSDPVLPGIYAPGIITVAILPAMPVVKPMPSPGLLAAIKRFLDRRRVICTRIEVSAPTYLIITVKATVKALQGASITLIRKEILTALQGFLNPLTGGPNGLGWPFGRSVYRAEILQIIANIPGVDHVDSMTISANSGTPQCGDIALCPTFLVASGPHSLQVVTS